MGVIDSDHVVEIIISFPCHLKCKKCIAQLLLLLFVMPGHPDDFRIRDFGSTNDLLLYLFYTLMTFTSKLTKNECPLITLEINEKEINIYLAQLLMFL